MYMCGIPFVVIRGSDEDWGQIVAALCWLRKTLGEDRLALGGIGQYLSKFEALMHDMRNVDTRDAVASKWFRLKECGSGHQAEVKGLVTVLYRKNPPNPGYVRNFPTHVSQVKYAYLPDNSKWHVWSGLFYSTLFTIESDVLLNPHFNAVTMPEELAAKLSPKSGKQQSNADGSYNLTLGPTKKL
jgi:hypothetical protein